MTTAHNINSIQEPDKKRRWLECALIEKPSRKQVMWQSRLDEESSAKDKNLTDDKGSDNKKRLIVEPRRMQEFCPAPNFSKPNDHAHYRFIT